jgi:hypothetical protein
MVLHDILGWTARSRPLSARAAVISTTLRAVESVRRTSGKPLSISVLERRLRQRRTTLPHQTADASVAGAQVFCEQLTILLRLNHARMTKHSHYVHRARTCS